jgi:hypothetical protein
MSRVSVAFFFPLSLALLALGCASSSFYLSPRLQPALTRANLGFEIADFWARTNRGLLEVVVRAAHEDSEYKEDFDLEWAEAAAVCAALANSNEAFEYDWRALDLKFWSEYGSMYRWHNTVGLIAVQMSRETLLMLRERGAPASEYPKYWQLLAGSKTGPGGKILDWKAAEPPSR